MNAAWNEAARASQPVQSCAFAIARFVGVALFAPVEAAWIPLRATVAAEVDDSTLTTWLGPLPDTSCATTAAGAARARLSAASSARLEGTSIIPPWVVLRGCPLTAPDQTAVR